MGQNLATVIKPVLEIGAEFPVRRDSDFYHIGRCMALAQLDRSKRRKRRLCHDFRYRTRGLDPTGALYARIAEKLKADLQAEDELNAAAVRTRWSQVTNEYGYTTPNSATAEALDIAMELFKRGERVEKRFDADVKAVSCQQCLVICTRCKKWGVGCATCRKVDCVRCANQTAATKKTPELEPDRAARKSRHRKFWLRVKEAVTPEEWRAMWATGTVDETSLTLIREILVDMDPAEEASLLRSMQQRRTEYDEKRSK